MNQNTYTIEVRKARPLTILPKMRNIFTRDVMAANANRDTILLENVPDITIKLIAKETNLNVYTNNHWRWIPVRTPEHIIDQILSGVFDNSTNDVIEPAVEEAPIEEDLDVVIPTVEKDVPVETIPYVQEELPVLEDPINDIVTQHVPEEDPVLVIGAHTEVPSTPISEISPQQFKSVPRNNGGKNRNNNGKK